MIWTERGGTWAAPRGEDLPARYPFLVDEVILPGGDLILVSINFRCKEGARWCCCYRYLPARSMEEQDLT